MGREYGEGVSPSHPTRGSGERRGLPQRGLAKRIWCILTPAGGVTVRYRKCRYCHVMYKLLYPSIRVRTAPPVSVRVRTRVSVLVLVLRFCRCPADFCDSGPESMQNSKRKRKCCTRIHTY